MEVFSEQLQDFSELDQTEREASNLMIPPLAHLKAATTLTFLLFLDTKRPLSEPGWCKSGDVEEWLAREFGRSCIPTSWKGKIQVIDPDEVRKQRCFHKSF